MLLVSARRLHFLRAAAGGPSLPTATNSELGALKNNKIFAYTGKRQLFVVPAGVL